MFSSKTPHFFRIILDNHDQNEKLKIPKKFWEKFGGTLGDAVKVKLPCGSEWEMKVSNQGGEFWFETGWSDFAKHYALKRGHLLVFSYHGASKFDLIICDTTLVEIDYPFTRPETTLQDDYCFTPFPENIDENPQPLKRRATLDPKHTSTEPEVKKRDDSGMKPLRGMEKTAALKKASSFKSDRPFFILLVQSSYTCSNGAVIESKFANRYLKDKSGSVSLKVLNKRSWSVNYHRHRGRRRLVTEFVTRFGSGWKKFAQDNDLKPHDVCVFILIKGSKKSFQVEIIRENGGSIALEVIPRNNPTNGKADLARPRKNLKERRALTSAEQATILGRAHFKHQKPFFEVALRPTYTRPNSYLGVPQDFAKKHIKKECDIVLLCNSKSVRVKFTFARFTRGWGEFVNDNDLKVDDVCIFVLIKRAKTKMTFEVTIRRSLDSVM